MQQRILSASSGRPSGMDGSDFSYRMVVDSRYTKVAKGKSRLSKLIFSQAAIQLIGLLCAYLLTSKEEVPNTVAIRVSFLRVYMVASSIIVIRSVINVVKVGSALEVIKNPSEWESKKFELLGTACILLGLVVQIFLVSTIISLIGNMSLPKKAS